MSEPIVKIEIASEMVPGWRQWGTRLFWRKEAGKMTVITKNITAICAICLVVLTIMLLFVAGPNEDRRTVSGVASPAEIVSSAHVLNIPSYDSRPAKEQTAAAKKRSRSPTKELVYSAPLVVMRPGGGKIPPGTMARALLLTGGSNGPVKAEIREAISINGEEVIEQGATLIGQGQSGSDRLFISFTQMIHRSGEVEQIQAQGCDPVDKIVGIKGSKVGREFSKLAAGAGLNFLGGLSVGLQESDYQAGFGARRANFKNAALNGASTAALEQTRENISDYRSKKEIIEVPAQSDLYILFNQ